MYIYIYTNLYIYRPLHKYIHAYTYHTYIFACDGDESIRFRYAVRVRLVIR